MMTIKRAIHLLHRLQDEQFDGPHGDERREALSMAARALSSQQTDTDSQGLVNDCISRQQAIDAVDKRFDSIPMEQTTEILMLRKDLRELPSAQPVNYGSTKSDSSSQLKLNNDLISRRQAIGALNDEYHGMISDESMKIYQIINWISALPSAQLDCKKGWWVEMGVNADKTHNIVCSKCGEGYKTKGHAKSIATRAKWKFCPSCGADMRGERDG